MEGLRLQESDNFYSARSLERRAMTYMVFWQLLALLRLGTVRGSRQQNARKCRERTHHNTSSITHVEPFAWQHIKAIIGNRCIRYRIALKQMLCAPNDFIHLLLCSAFLWSAQVLWELSSRVSEISTKKVSLNKEECKININAHLVCTK